MEPLLFLCLSFGFILRTDCQSVSQKPHLINGDKIVFTDNVPDRSTHTVHQVSWQELVNGRNFEYPFYTQNSDQNTYVPNVAQRPTFVPNVVQRPTNKPNVDQKPVRSFNTDDQPQYDPGVIIDKRFNLRPRVQFDATSAALANFTLNIMRKVVTQKQGNIVVSPYSVASLLSLVQQGATDDALKQISLALQMKPQESADAYKKQTDDIQSRSSRNILRSANSIFVADTFSLNPQFKSIAQRNFDSDVTPTSFQSSELAAQQINSWVASKTENKILNLVTPESIASNSQMVLVNAMYFKGIWEAPFKTSSTAEDTFFLNNGETKRVPFMAIRRYYKAGIDSETGSKVIVLPFEHEEYSLMIILPSILSNAHDAYGLLTVSILERYLNLNSIEVALKIPKFAIRADTNLTPVLKEMGITKIFEQDSGLSNLGLHNTYAPQVSSSVHSAILSIDEEGGSAAAASAFAVVALSNDSPSLALKVNRPFLAILWDTKTKVPLFTTIIEDPSL